MLAGCELERDLIMDAQHILCGSEITLLFEAIFCMAVRDGSYAVESVMKYYKFY